MWICCRPLAWSRRASTLILVLQCRLLAGARLLALAAAVGVLIAHGPISHYADCSAWLRVAPRLTASFDIRKPHCECLLVGPLLAPPVMLRPEPLPFCVGSNLHSSDDGSFSVDKYRFLLLFGFIKGTEKEKGQKGTTGEPSPTEFPDLSNPGRSCHISADDRNPALPIARNIP